MNLNWAHHVIFLNSSILDFNFYLLQKQEIAIGRLGSGFGKRKPDFSKKFYLLVDHDLQKFAFHHNNYIPSYVLCYFIFVLE
jgi:hypothetical protein